MANMKWSAALRNAAADAITTAAGSGAKLRIYNGTQPATGGGSDAGSTLLVELICGTPFAASASGGVLTLTSIPSVNAVDTNTATWFRIQTSGDTYVIDGDVTNTSGDGDLKLTNTSLSSGGAVSVDFAQMTAPHA